MRKRLAPLAMLAALTCACGGPPAPPSAGLGGLLGDQPTSRASAAPSAAPPAAPVPVSAGERGKIDRLIELVRKSKIAFVRNGKAHEPGSAADHLASKLEGAADPSMTARDFIQRLASFSSQSGEPYLVRFPDGKTIPAGDWLLARLAEIEAAQRGDPSASR
jgi:hypothetical protein